MKLTYTKGPWHWNAQTREIRGPQESGVIVARLPEWGVAAHAPDATEANARLLAAAPELFDALLAAVAGNKMPEAWLGQARMALAMVDGAAFQSEPRPVAKVKVNQVRVDWGGEVSAPVVEMTPEFEAILDRNPGVEFPLYAEPIRGIAAK